MVLIVGSEGAGKRAYLEKMGYGPRQIADGVLDDKPVLYHLERLTARDPDRAGELLEALLKKEVVVCNEVGSGVIPVTHEERAAREETGRLCVRLAQQADAVVRLICGFPQAIKGELPCR